MYRQICETIERAVNEQQRRLSDDDMAFLEPYIVHKGNDGHGTTATVDDAFWYGANGNIYRAWLQKDPFIDRWEVGGTRTLDWITWGRVDMIRPGNRYKSALL